MQSFSEIETTSKRASKAAGFAWGIAEEVGKNMRNLEMFGLPGVKNLNLYLKKINKNSNEKPKKIEKIVLSKLSKKLLFSYLTDIFFPTISEALLKKGKNNKG